MKRHFSAMIAIKVTIDFRLRTGVPHSKGQMRLLEEPQGGDILTHYKPLVGCYLAWQIANWTLAFLQLGGVVGGASWGFVETSIPADISFCLMMFLATLHSGELPDGRLRVVCNIAFIIDGTAILVNQLAIFRPNSLQDALAYAK